MTNRRTSTYKVSVEGDDNTLREMLKDLPVSLYSHGVFDGRAFVQFRVADDETALAVASVTSGHRDFVLETGYGVHQRTVVV